MTDKERLAGIKDNLISYIRTLGIEYNNQQALIKDVRFLIQQSENVQQARHWGNETASENKRLRKQLEGLLK